MPTVTVPNSGGFRIFFYSSDGVEAPHVHVRKGDGEVKYWVALGGVRLARVRGMSRQDRRLAKQVVVENVATILEAWHAYFSANH